MMTRLGALKVTDNVKERVFMRLLGHLEARVMEQVWRSGTPVAVRHVHDLLQSEHPVAYTTVLTVMDNLHSKGLLMRERVGRAYRYAAAQTREAYGAELMNQVLDTSADRSATLLRFVESIPPSEIDDLRAALEARELDDH